MLGKFLHSGAVAVDVAHLPLDYLPLGEIVLDEIPGDEDRREDSGDKS